VVGYGPGIGGAEARCFAEAGYTVAALSRSGETDVGTGYACDVTDEDALRATFARIHEELGPVDTLLWNVGSGMWGDIDAIGTDALDLAYQTNTRGLFLATQAVLPAMREQGSGNIIITGATASLRGKPFTTAFAAGKAAQRSLAESLARKLWPEGIHVALLIIDGMVDLPNTRKRMPDAPDAQFVSPDGVADTALFLCRQDPRAWTFQLELRPSVEAW
jgi:NAD(P)-dependent dehydrogenase (short-subunit alcohol dehydrogenase family)